MYYFSDCYRCGDRSTSYGERPPLCQPRTRGPNGRLLLYPFTHYCHLCAHFHISSTVCSPFSHYMLTIPHHSVTICSPFLTIQSLYAHHFSPFSHYVLTISHHSVTICSPFSHHSFTGTIELNLHTVVEILEFQMILMERRANMDLCCRCHGLSTSFTLS